MAIGKPDLGYSVDQAVADEDRRPWSSWVYTQRGVFCEPSYWCRTRRIILAEILGMRLFLKIKKSTVVSPGP